MFLACIILSLALLHLMPNGLLHHALRHP